MKLLILPLLAIMCMAATSTSAQVLNPVKWDFSAQKVSTHEYIIKAKAKIDSGWYIYYSCDDESKGPIVTTFEIEAPKGFVIVEKMKAQTKAKSLKDNFFEMDVQIFEKEVVYEMKVKRSPAARTAVVSGGVEFMTCTKAKCLAPEFIEFSLPLN